MYSICPTINSYLNDEIPLKIGLTRGWWSNKHRFICIANMQRIAICFGIDSDSSNTHLSSTLHDPDGNFTAIGN